MSDDSNVSNSSPSIKAILEYWEVPILHEANGFLIDIGEPTCWACNQGWNGKYDIKHSGFSFIECVRCWQRAPLQRCHIVPKSLGGSNDPSNLFLMCTECHDLAPNTTNRELFFRWTISQHYYKRQIAQIWATFESFGIDRNDKKTIELLSYVIQFDEFSEWSEPQTGLHRLQDRGGISLTKSSTLGLALMFLESMDAKNIARMKRIVKRSNADRMKNLSLR